MFSFSEMLFIAILALLVIGPKQLPAVARQVGRFLNEIRRAGESAFSELKKNADLDGSSQPQKNQTQNNANNEVKAHNETKS